MASRKEGNPSGKIDKKKRHPKRRQHHRFTFASPYFTPHFLIWESPPHHKRERERGGKKEPPLHRERVEKTRQRRTKQRGRVRHCSFLLWLDTSGLLLRRDPSLERDLIVERECLPDKRGDAREGKTRQGETERLDKTQRRERTWGGPLDDTGSMEQEHACGTSSEHEQAEEQNGKMERDQD